MGWLSGLAGLFGASRAPVLTAAQSDALAAWQRLPPVDLEAPHAHCRYVVVDVESSGLDLRRDRLISIGAVAVAGGRIDADDAFAVVLRQERVSSDENILIHGIGAGAQSEGVDPADALLAFLQHVGKSPLVAYHAFFDQAMIASALREYLGIDFGLPWIDLAWVLPELLRGGFSSALPRALDDWLALCAIGNIQRHNAVSDAYATAQLLLMAIAAGRAAGAASPAALVRIEKARRWQEQCR